MLTTASQVLEALGHILIFRVSSVPLEQSGALVMHAPGLLAYLHMLGSSINSLSQTQTSWGNDNQFIAQLSIVSVLHVSTGVRSSGFAVSRKPGVSIEYTSPVPPT